MLLHRKNYRTAYEVAAINKVTGERIFVAVSSGSKSRQAIQHVLFRELSAGETRLDRIIRETGRAGDTWEWSRVASEGILSGDWTVRFTGRTALEVDQRPLARSIYREKVAA